MQQNSRFLESGHCIPVLPSDHPGLLDKSPGAIF